MATFKRKPASVRKIREMAMTLKEFKSKKIKFKNEQEAVFRKNAWKIGDKFKPMRVENYKKESFWGKTGVITNKTNSQIEFEIFDYRGN